MRLHSYVVARDFGFAPNPFHGYCTLGTCQSPVRSGVKEGDWVMGTGGKRMFGEHGHHNLSEHLIFLMEVSEVLRFDEYWDDSRFQLKKPQVTGSKMFCYGDNIYPPAGSNQPAQVNSHHSQESGRPHLENMRGDKKVDAVLVSTNYWYFGINALEIDGRFLSYPIEGEKPLSVCHTRKGKRNNMLEPLKDEFIQWATSQYPPGVHGLPASWF